MTTPDGVAGYSSSCYSSSSSSSSVIVLHFSTFIPPHPSPPLVQRIQSIIPDNPDGIVCHRIQSTKPFPHLPSTLLCLLYFHSIVPKNPVQYPVHYPKQPRTELPVIESSPPDPFPISPPPSSASHLIVPKSIGPSVQRIQSKESSPVSSPLSQITRTELLVIESSPPDPFSISPPPSSASPSSSQSVHRSKESSPVSSPVSSPLSQDNSGRGCLSSSPVHQTHSPSRLHPPLPPHLRLNRSIGPNNPVQYSIHYPKQPRTGLPVIESSPPDPIPISPPPSSASHLIVPKSIGPSVQRIQSSIQSSIQSIIPRQSRTELLVIESSPPVPIPISPPPSSTPTSSSPSPSVHLSICPRNPVQYPVQYPKQPRTELLVIESSPPAQSPSPTTLLCLVIIVIPIPFSVPFPSPIHSPDPPLDPSSKKVHIPSPVGSVGVQSGPSADGLPERRKSTAWGRVGYKG
ncbi:hypothetical protein EDC01DRAFT_725145 [Geopyxis carbonaria]|nr:hypothetical protein EDC01DRAFT_725145 [Geopyxis carbonaria]